MLKIWALILLPLLAYAGEDFSRLARSPLDQQIIQRNHYSLSYNNDHEVANWVSYSLEHYHLQACVGRTNSFREDPLVEGGSATLDDYKNSNFDRGHLLPAGDMKFEKEAMRDTFYLSNMTPQPARFNRGRWSSLETLIRAWALKYHKIWIVTGPVLTDSLPSIGRQNRVSVPHEYFKVILRKSGNTYKGMAFLMGIDVPYPHLSSYAVSIDTIEDMTGIDFFSFLSDRTEDEVESRLNLKDWDFKAKFEYFPCPI